MLLSRLRHSTSTLHRHIEVATLGSLPNAQAMDQPTYERLLYWQYRAHAHLEARLPPSTDLDYPYQPRVPALRADLDRLLAAPGLLSPADESPYSWAQAAGVLYVLEGSALGSSVISQWLRSSPHLQHIDQFTFYEFQRQQARTKWPLFRQWLASQPADEPSAVQAEAAAQRAFEVFLEYW